MSHGLEKVFQRLEGDALENAVTRFLGWRLPNDFEPDGGVSFVYRGGISSWPCGTNLLTAAQAREMLRFVLNADEAQKREATTVVASEMLRLIEQLCQDLNEAHDELMVAQGLPREQAKRSDWPEWSSPSNSIRWAERLLGKSLGKT